LKSFRHVILGNWSDRFLFFVVLSLIGYLWFSLYQDDEQASVSIYYEKQLVAWYPLPQNKVIQLNVLGYLGLSRLQIDVDGVQFLSSPCQTQYCVAQSKKHQAGQITVCAPNHVMFVIHGESSLDAITQ